MATVFGRYTLVRKLATGGMAEVFLARVDGPMGFQKKCVVKRILPHFSDDQQFVQMFLGEARLAAELNHPNLVQIFDFGEVDGQYFIAMEYIEGPNLRVLNREVRASSGPVPLPLVARMLTLAAEGLHFAHELKDEHGKNIDLVHRDISPDNILVSRQGSVKVVDFGIAKAANQPHLTKSGMIKGKLAYMPPEQLAREPLDRRADIYALGVVLYELVCGEMPFDATSEVSIIQAIMGHDPLQRAIERRDDVPPMLDAIIARCLEKDRERRYATCRELQVDLERFVQVSGVVVAPSDIAAIIEQTFASSFVQTAPNTVPTGAGLDATAPRKSSERQSAQTTARKDQNLPPGSSSTALRPIEERPVEAPPRNGVPVPVVVGLLVALAAAGAAFFFLKPGPTPVGNVAVTLDAGAPTPVAVKPSVAPVVDAGPPPTEPEPAPDAGQAEPAADAGQPEPAIDAGGPLHPTHVVHATGRLDIRVRPNAIVSIDGRDIGDTPVPVQVLPLGKHKIRLVNDTLGKDIVIEFVVKEGDNLFKYNLKE